jgi:pimeloyl-ACP methyl ester carboxylesterase
VKIHNTRVDVAPGAQLAVTVFGGEAGAGPAPVLFLFPGGGLNRHYYDLALGADDSYSQARWLAGRGATVVTVDHLGTGDSTLPDGAPSGAGGRTVDLGRDEVDRAGDAAVRAVLGGLRDGSLHPDLPTIEDPVAIGSGHSLGGHVVTSMQASYGTFAGIAPFGASMTWTRLTLGEGHRQPFRAAPGLDHKAVVLGTDWTGNDFWDDAAADVVRRNTDRANSPLWRRTTIPSFAGDLLEPFASARQAAAVRVPVLLVYGERDVTVEPLDDVAVFRAAPSVALTVVPRMAHGHNFASTRQIAWARLESFAREVVVLRELGYPD